MHYQFSVTAGRSFMILICLCGSGFLLSTWWQNPRKVFLLISLKGVLAVSYKTAWYLCHRSEKPLRKLVISLCWNGLSKLMKLMSAVNTIGVESVALTKNKAVVGLLERDGKFEAKTIKNSKQESSYWCLRKRVDTKATVMTDELLHTNPSVRLTNIRPSTIELKNGMRWCSYQWHWKAWSLFKRSISVLIIKSVRNIWMHTLMNLSGNLMDVRISICFGIPLSVAQCGLS